MTGNPVHFSGRERNDFIAARAPQLYYQALDQNFVNQQILERSLQTWFPAQGLRRNAMDTTLSLYQEYQKLLPETLVHAP